MSYALVTGGSKGIGYAIAHGLASKGLNLILFARAQAGLDSAESKLKAEFPKVEIVTKAIDVTNSTDLESAISACFAQSKQISVLINNAGGAESLPFKKTGLKEWKASFDLNVHSAFWCSKLVYSKMVEAKSGRIINIASIAGLRGFPYVSAYCASKHALIGFSRALATELNDTGVSVATVCPGYTETEMIATSLKQVASKTGKSEADIRKDFLAQTSQKSFIQPESIADAVLRLIQMPTEQMNGQEVVIE